MVNTFCRNIPTKVRYKKSDLQMHQCFSIADVGLLFDNYIANKDMKHRTDAKKMKWF